MLACVYSSLESTDTDIDSDTDWDVDMGHGIYEKIRTYTRQEHGKKIKSKYIFFYY